MFRATQSRNGVARQVAQELPSVTAENVARQVAETLVESTTRFKQLSASLYSHRNPLPSVNACAIFVQLVSQCVERQLARKLAQHD